MTKTQQTIEHIVVTFFEAAIAYIIVIPTVNWGKTVIAGAIGAGLSAVYNVLRQSTPTITELPTSTITQIPVVTPEEPPVTNIN